MLPESAADARTAPIYKKYPNVETTVLAGQGQVEFHLRATAATPARKLRLQSRRLPENSRTNWTTPYFPPEASRWRRSLATTCRCAISSSPSPSPAPEAWSAERITSVPGSSRFFLGGAVVYSNDLKTLFADVPPLMIEAYGAVSKEVALALAENIREICNADIGLGVTGIAGPAGGTEEKPVGLVYIAVTDGKKHEVVQRRFPGDRERIRRWASQQALDLVRRILM